MAFDDAGPCHHTINYVTSAVQADVSDVERSEPEVGNTTTEQVIERVPVPSGRNKTFPAAPKKCKGDCCEASQNFEEEHPRKPSRTSRVTWQGIESSTQTEATNTPILETLQQGTEFQGKNLSFPSASPMVDRSKTFPSSSMTDRSSKLIQQAPRLRSPNTTISEQKPQATQPSDPDYKVSTPPTRHPPPPPLCSQCAGPLDSDIESEIRESPQEPGFETEARLAPAHACTSRSSMLCQQCFPSRQASLAISPLQTNKPVEVSYLPSSRRSTRPMVPTGSVTYIEQFAAPTEQPVIEVKQCLDSEKGKEIHRAIVNEALKKFANNEPVADPMKRTSIPRLKLKPTPSLPSLPKRPHNTSRSHQLPSIAQRPLVIATACPLDHVAASSTSVDSIPSKPGQVTDKQVFRGLHVATAAACDEDVDKWIEEITGTGVRKFLADLSAFEGLGVNTLANVAKRAARQRREQLRAWEEVRERILATQSREIERENGGSEAGDEDDDLKVGSFVIGDQGVHWNGRDEIESREEDTLIGDQGVSMQKDGD